MSKADHLRAQVEVLLRSALQEDQLTNLRASLHALGGYLPQEEDDLFHVSLQDEGPEGFHYNILGAALAVAHVAGGLWEGGLVGSLAALAGAHSLKHLRSVLPKDAAGILWVLARSENNTVGEEDLRAGYFALPEGGGFTPTEVGYVEGFGYLLSQLGAITVAGGGVVLRQVCLV